MSLKSTYQACSDFMCPYCNEPLKLEDWYEHFNHDDETKELECPNCGKEIKVHCSFNKPTFTVASLYKF